MRRKGAFEKGFTPNWTEEVFTITAVKATKPPTWELGKPVQGSFYEQELQSSVQELYRMDECSRREKTEFLLSGKVTAVRSIRGYH